VDVEVKTLTTKDKPTALEPRGPRTSIEVSFDTRDELADLAHKRESYDAALKRIMRTHRECKCDWVKARAPSGDEAGQVQFVILDFRTKRPEESTREFVDRSVEEQLERAGISLKK
jgi:hypothetical protein